MKYFIGILGTVVGFFIVWKTEGFMSWTGRIDFAERWFGTEGGTRIVLKAIGLLIIIVAWMYMLNLGESILRFLFLPTVRPQ
jgi:hypothetical protein